MTASLQPVRMPGSTPSTALGPNGAAISSLRTFSANTEIAASSAISRSVLWTSFSIAGTTYARRAMRDARRSSGAPANEAAARPGRLRPRRPRPAARAADRRARRRRPAARRPSTAPAPPRPSRGASPDSGATRAACAAPTPAPDRRSSSRSGCWASPCPPCACARSPSRRTPCAPSGAGPRPRPGARSGSRPRPPARRPASATPLSASTKACARDSGVSPAAGAIAPCAQSHSHAASGSRPASFAIVALVLRFCL